MTGVDQSSGTPGFLQLAPSQTALATATMRALATHDEREEIRGPDYLAEAFLTEDRKGRLNDPRVRQWVMKNIITPGVYEFMIARTAFFDQVVKGALEGHVPQLVFLGAGYDSRPYRFRELAEGTRIFELDAGPTQARKKEMLSKEAIALPAQLVFAAIDFAADDLGAVLLKAGFAREEKAFFVWEGVTYYLSAEAVDETLAAVRRISIDGSSICFDYASLSAEARGDEATRKLKERMQSEYVSEPTRFGIPQGQLTGFLAARGYAVIENLGPADMLARYLTLRDGATIGKPPMLFSLVHAALHS
jgi:methyltransferase (TIGR00027 family)